MSQLVAERSAQHDDLVLALCLGLWYCERAPKRLPGVLVQRGIRLGGLRNRGGPAGFGPWPGR